MEKHLGNFSFFTVIKKTVNVFNIFAFLYNNNLISQENINFQIFIRVR